VVGKLIGVVADIIIIDHTVKSNVKPPMLAEAEDENSDQSSQGTTDQSSQGTKGGERAGKAFTKKGKREVVEANKAKNNGQTTCENCNQNTVPGQKSESGVTPPGNETQIDHIYPKSKGGDGSPSNGQVLCRDCNRTKSDKVPE